MTKTRIVSQDIGDATVLPADLDVSADNTTSDSTTGHHGLLPKLGGGSSNYLRADGSWAAPAGAGLSSGTSFPGGPANNDLYYRTDLDLLFFYDGTRWLSVTLYTDPMPFTIAIPIAATAAANRMATPVAGSLGIWFEGLWMSFFVSGGTALGASHKWVCVLTYVPANTTLATINVDSGASNTWRNSGTVGTPAAIATTEFELELTSTKTGTPGTLYPIARVSYRLIGT